ncbi:7-cyano-7-deazaguanine synthase QueC [Candidatus Uabimicrobium amorphum]|uniref:7-cyano-7-deazaguanine synthase n=1 Tax=Uabimicrobium amorphum TaxID=2596890 RepID=A0A5S9IJD0_UABAM|nr:7-cyano-7-deazaguanine synthase QueC [Candidatus Uabimicrobium amorphum]BBM82617.1 7-cyano-7-deazaguanine synthase [Candidatus Uabimicrobium amorphum]
MEKNNRHKKAIVLLSGGMDSVTALYWANENLQVQGAVSFDYGAKHNHKEIPFAQKHCALLGIKHNIISLQFMNDLFTSNLLKSGGDIPEGHYEEENMKLTVVPFRNGIMLAIAAGYAESIQAQHLVIAAHAGDHAIYPDCRESFMQSMSNAIKNGTYSQTEIIRPFIEDRKEDIAQKGNLLGVDYALTWSCYKGKELHCGKCGTCVERKEAFAKANLNDPTQYELD